MISKQTEIHWICLHLNALLVTSNTQPENIYEDLCLSDFYEKDVEFRL